MSAIDRYEEARLEGLPLHVQVELTDLPFGREIAEYADRRGIRLAQAVVKLIEKGLQA